MNILVINHYAGSPLHGMEYRHYYLAKEWLKLGYNVTIVGASFSHLRNKQPEINGDLTKEIIDGIEYVWLKTPKYQGNGLMRVNNMLTFVIQLLRYKQYFIKSKPDIVIASSPHPFIIFAANKISKKAEAKLVFEVRDLWPITLVELGNLPRWHPFIMLMQFTENFAYRVSDRIVSLLPKADIHMIKHGMSREKFVYIPNGIDVNEWNSNQALMPDEHRKILKGIKDSGNFIVGYTGTHGLANSLHYLVDSAKHLIDFPVTIVMVGHGPEKEKLKKRVKELELSNVVFLPPVNKTSIPDLLTVMDAVYIGLDREPLFRFGISPNKLMDYMMSGKPIIHAIEAGNDLVLESRSGLSISPENPMEIAKAVINLLKISKDEIDKMGDNGRKYVLENHDYNVLAEKLLNAIY